jgi:K+-sensing histidine kinase KdpD
MQQSLSTRMGELQRLSATLKERGEELQATYEHAQAADRMKTNFLYNMSDQMMAPVGGIVKSVETICDHSGETAEEDTGELVDEIQRQGSKVTALLNELIKDSEKIMN